MSVSLRCPFSISIKPSITFPSTLVNDPQRCTGDRRNFLRTQRSELASASGRDKFGDSARRTDCGKIPLARLFLPPPLNTQICPDLSKLFSNCFAVIICSKMVRQNQCTPKITGCPSNLENMHSIQNIDGPL